MSKTICNILLFVAGAAVGSLVTAKIVKTKYEQLAEKEIDEVREFYKSKTVKEPVENQEKKITPENNKEEQKNQYATMVRDLRYVSDSEEITEKKEEELDMDEKPYIISPDDFDSIHDYGTISLTWYADEVLTDDETDTPFEEEDIERTIGTDFSSHFGEYENDTVYVRNDRLKCDYEICRDLRNWFDLNAPAFEDDDYDE